MGKHALDRTRVGLLLQRRREHLHAGRDGCAYHAVLCHARLFEQVRGDTGGGDEAAHIELHLDPLAKSGRVAVTYLMREAISSYELPLRVAVTSRRYELPLRVAVTSCRYVPSWRFRSLQGEGWPARCTPPRVLGQRNQGAIGAQSGRNQGAITAGGTRTWHAPDRWRLPRSNERLDTGGTPSRPQSCRRRSRRR